MNDNLRNERGWQMDEGQLKRAMGVTDTTKWPDEGMDPKLIGNTVVRVKPKNPKGGKSHRAMAICATCGREVPAGRLHQHQKVHK